MLTTDHSVYTGERPLLRLRGQYALSELLCGDGEQPRKLPQLSITAPASDLGWWWGGNASETDNVTFISTSLLRKEPGSFISIFFLIL